MRRIGTETGTTASTPHLRDAAHNAAALRALLEGAPGAYRDIVLMNAGAALVVAGRVPTLAEGVKLAAKAIDDGSARARLDALILVSNG